MLEIHITQAPDLPLTHIGATIAKQRAGVRSACEEELGLWDLVALGWNSGSAIHWVYDFRQVT